jgi:hypothetical protein
MFVRDLLLIELRSNILRRLQRFLHLLRKFIRTHTSPYSSHVNRQPGLNLVRQNAVDVVDAAFLQ